MGAPPVSSPVGGTALLALSLDVGDTRRVLPARGPPEPERPGHLLGVGHIGATGMADLILCPFRDRAGVVCPEAPPRVTVWRRPSGGPRGPG